MIELRVTKIEFNLFSIIYTVEPVKKGLDINGKAVFTNDDIADKDLILKSNVVVDNKVVFAPLNVKPAHYQKILQKDTRYTEYEYQLSYIYLEKEICGHVK